MKPIPDKVLQKTAEMWHESSGSLERDQYSSIEERFQALKDEDELRLERVEFISENLLMFEDEDITDRTIMDSLRYCGFEVTSEYPKQTFILDLMEAQMHKGGEP